MTAATRFGPGSILWQALGQAMEVLRARFGDEADLFRLLDDIATARRLADAYRADLNKANG